METKQVQVKDGEYTCDIDITVEEWKEILQDQELFSENYKNTLLKFYNEPDHKGTCKAIGDKYNIKSSSVRAIITAFAKAVQKKLNRFELVGVDENPTYWIIPMRGKKVDEHFEWQMREELTKAITDLEIFMHNSFKVNSLKELVDKINYDLGDFIDKFRYKRKELASLGRAPSSGILFKYDNNERDWSINEGGGTEVQYHLFSRGNTIGYGIGFNTQYVPFHNDMSTVDFMQPFASAFLMLQNSINVKSLTNKGFKFYKESLDVLKNIQDNEYYLFGNEIILNDGMMDGKDYTMMLDSLKGDLFNLYCEIFETRNKIIELNNSAMDFVQLLKSSKNLILTGAPGTGKTYLARDIASLMIFGEIKDIGKLTESEKKIWNEQYAFVQFHPSYDYTDFVEGLRPTEPDENGNIGFERKDGTFKAFCKKALKASISDEVDNFSESWENLLDLVKSNLAEGNLTKIGGWDYGLSTKESLKYKSENTPSGYSFTINKRNVYDAYQQKQARPSGAFQRDMELVVEYMKEHLGLKEYKEGNLAEKENTQNYVFIIDEINRGEISKIFGELFFSIDPGYRGKGGKVQTQYSNLIENGDVFKNGFFIPENVYVIGTMNDIDRSVESFDFAMRRRFAWKEISAPSSKHREDIAMWDVEVKGWRMTDEIKKEAMERIIALNDKIESIPGLGSAFQIGPAYFLKLQNYTDDFSQLWEMHLEGVIYEYLRGFPERDKHLKDLKLAYNLTSEAKENADNN